MRRTIIDLFGEARASVEGLEPAAALAEQRAGALIVDTRDLDSHRRTGIIPGSVHVALSVLFWRLDPASESKIPELADLDRRIVLVCNHGYSSALAAATLRDLGFTRATDIVGGFEAWQAAGLPLESAEGRSDSGKRD